MLKRALLAATGAAAVVSFATAVAGPTAIAASPECKTPRPNRYVACTDKLKAKTPGAQRMLVPAVQKVRAPAARRK
jgi:hypothetical protein